MSFDLKLIYRNRITRAVTNVRPAIAVQEANVDAHDRMCQVLVDVEEMKTLLCDAGYGFPSKSLPDLLLTALGFEAS